MSRIRRDSIELHGWDARARAWHGPTLLQFSTRQCAKLIDQLRRSAGCWYGKLHADLPGEPRLTFCACVHDPGDAGLGMLDLEGTEGGPLQFILVAPARRRYKLRADMAFEFVSFIRFLAGPDSVGDELALHDYVEMALERDERDPCVLRRHPGSAAGGADPFGATGGEAHVRDCRSAGARKVRRRRAEVAD